MTDTLKSLVSKQFPGATLQQGPEGQVYFVTVHGSGKTEEEAMENSLRDFSRMAQDGRDLPTIIADIRADLTQSGMTRKRHDSLLDLVNIAEAALDSGVVANTVPWIMVAGYTRTLEELRRRIAARLGMAAQEFKDREAARKKASEKRPQPVTTYAEMRARVRVAAPSA